MSISEFLDRYEEIFGAEEGDVVFEYWNEDEGRWLSSDER